MKVSIFYPETRPNSMNGVISLVESLYDDNIQIFRNNKIEIEKIGVWFDQRLKHENIDISASENEYEKKKEIKEEILKIIKSIKPDIIHFHLYAIDIDVLNKILKYAKENNIKTVYTFHSICADEVLYGLSEKLLNEDFKKEFIELSKIFFNLSEEEKRKRLINLIWRFDKDLAYYAIENKGFLESLVIRLYMQALQTKLIQESNVVTFVSNYLKKRASKFWKLPENYVIENGSNIWQEYERKKDIIDKKAKDWKKKLFGENAIIISYIGRIEPRKGIEELIKAYDELDFTITYKFPFFVRLPKKIHLVIIGRGNEEYIEFLKGIPQRREVYFVDTSKYKANREQIIGYYIASDIIVYPSYEEAFGLVPVEAAQLGKICIVRNDGNLKNFVREGICRGFYSKRDLKNELLNAISDVLEIRLGEKEIIGKIERIKNYARRKYDLSRCVNEYIQLYKRLIPNL